MHGVCWAWDPAKRIIWPQTCGSNTDIDAAQFLISLDVNSYSRMLVEINCHVNKHEEYINLYFRFKTRIRKGIKFIKRNVSCCNREWEQFQIKNPNQIQRLEWSKGPCKFIIASIKHLVSKFILLLEVSSFQQQVPKQTYYLTNWFHYRHLCHLVTLPNTTKATFYFLFNLSCP